MVLSCPLDYRYGRKEMKEIFSEEGKLERLLLVEAALAQAQARVGNIPPSAAQEIARKANLKHVRPERVRELEAETRHDIMAVVRALAEVCEGSAGGFIHMGATSYDIVDTANALMLQDALSILESDLLELVKVLSDLARAHRTTPCLARTHGQAALPTTFGYKMAVFAWETRRHLDRLREIAPRVVVGKMAGAVGTMDGFGTHAFEIEREVSRELSIPMEEAPTQIVGRDRYNELFAWAANLSTSLEKFSTEVRNLQRSEIGEVREGFDVERQVGSSTMAQKRNPVTAEKICGLSRIVRSSLTVSFENSLQWHERDLSNSSSERFLFPHTFILLDEILQDSVRLFRNLEVRVDRMEENLRRFPEIMAEPLMMALVRKGMGRQEAHELVRRLSLRGEPFGESVRSDTKIRSLLSLEEIERALDPTLHVGQAPRLVDRALRLALRSPRTPTIQKRRASAPRTPTPKSQRRKSR